MANRYYLTKKAIEDLAEIWNYSYDTWSESQADKYYKLLTRHFQEITDGLVVGKRYFEVIENLFGSVIGQHIVFYRYLNETTVEIVRILHSRMDLRNRLDK